MHKSIPRVADKQKISIFTVRLHQYEWKNFVTSHENTKLTSLNDCEASHERLPNPFTWLRWFLTFYAHIRGNSHEIFHSTESWNVWSFPSQKMNLIWICVCWPQKNNVSEESSTWVKYLNKILLSAFTLASLFSLSSFRFSSLFSTHSLLFHWLARETRKILSYIKFRHRFVSCVAAEEFIHCIQSNDVCLS